MFAFILNCIYTKRILNYGFWEQIKDILPILISSLVMFLLLCGLSSFMESYWLQLGVGFVAGTLSYMLIAKLFKEPALEELLVICKSKIHRRKA